MTENQCKFPWAKEEGLWDQGWSISPNPRYSWTAVGAERQRGLRNTRNWGLGWLSNTVSFTAAGFLGVASSSYWLLVFSMGGKARPCTLSGLNSLDFKPPEGRGSLSLSAHSPSRKVFQAQLQPAFLTQRRVAGVIRVAWLVNLGSGDHTKPSQLWPGGEMAPQEQASCSGNQGVADGHSTGVHQQQLKQKGWSWKIKATRR